MRAYAAKLRYERLASAAKFLEFYAAKFCARMSKICNAFLRGEICGALLAGRFSAARRSKIRSAKYGAEFCIAVHGDKIYGAMADKKGFGTVLASVRNSGLKNVCLNLRPRNTYADLKFKGSTNSEPTGGVNFKFKNGANKILASVWTGRILSSGISAVDLVFDAAVKNFISSDAARILSSSAEAGILASSLANEILNLSAADEILKSNATGKILSLGAASRTDVELKGVGGC